MGLARLSGMLPSASWQLPDNLHTQPHAQPSDSPCDSKKSLTDSRQPLNACLEGNMDGGKSQIDDSWLSMGQGKDMSGAQLVMLLGVLPPTSQQLSD